MSVTPVVTNSYQNSGKKWAAGLLTVTGVATSGANPALLVLIWGHGRGGVEDIASVVWDNGGGDEITLTKLTVRTSGDQNAVLFYANDIPVAATHDILITAGGAPPNADWSWNGGGVIVLSLSDVDTVTGFENEAGASDTNTLSITSASGDLVAGVIGEGSASQTITPGTGDTEHQDVVIGTSHGVVNTDPSTGSSESVDWVGPTAERIISAVNIIAGPDPAGASLQTHQMML